MQTPENGEGGPKAPLTPSRKSLRKAEKIIGSLTIVASSVGVGFLWGDHSGRSAQRNYDVQGFNADRQALSQQQQQDQTMLNAALKLGQAGIGHVVGLHYGPHDTLYATVSTAKPGAKGACQEDFVYATAKDGNPTLRLHLPDASGEHVFADIVIDGPVTDAAAIKQIQANHPNGC